MGYGAILYFDTEQQQQHLFEYGRGLQVMDDAEEIQPVDADFELPMLDPDVEAAHEERARTLALNGDSPPSSDEVSGEYIVKPWIGRSQTDIYETDTETKIQLDSAQASNVQGVAFLPRNAIDEGNTRWASSVDFPNQDYEWVNIDMGLPQTLSKIYIKWYEEAYAQDFKVYVAFADNWIEVGAVTGNSATQNTLEITAPQGVQYVRIQMSKKQSGASNYSIYYVRLFRQPMIIGEAAGGTSCGSTTSSAASSLLSSHGGSLISAFETAEYFAASMTEAQKESMSDDPCVFTVEPNYVVRARGLTTTKKRKALTGEPSKRTRKLAIPEFNLRDTNPPNWGLERISSHGKPNGSYLWFHEGAETKIYVFDTGIYTDHSEWLDHNATNRVQLPYICTGTDTEFAVNDHGTHIASIAAGFKTGTGKSAKIYPIQVLNGSGEGTTASVLCGMEKLLQDGIAYNAANAPNKIRAIVNLSLGVNGRSDALDKVAYEMTAVGYTVVIAAGDNDDNACFYSPYIDTAITVGALSNDANGKNDKTSSSNYGECIDIWAPGEDIAGATNSGEYDTVLKSGTSVAAAFVSGVASLFFEELNTAEFGTDELAARVKENVLYKAEINILDKIGHGSPNRIVQTTAVRCLVNSHCSSGLTCLRDGTCRDTSKPLKKIK